MKNWWLLVAVVVVLILGGVAAMIPATAEFFSDLIIPKNQYDGHSKRYWTGALKDSDPEVRHHAMIALGAMGADAGDVAPQLAQIMVDDADTVAREKAAQALSKMYPATQAVVSQLGQALGDTNLAVRLHAAMALAQLGAEARPVIPQLLKALEDKENRTNLDAFPFTIQEEAAVALGRARATEAIPILMGLLQKIDDDPSIKIETHNTGRATAKGKVNNAESTNTVIRDKMVFAKALGDMGPDAKPAVPLLQRMLKKDQVSDFKQSAEEALRRIEGTASEAKG
jgi:HEAT repeat protein